MWPKLLVDSRIMRMYINMTRVAGRHGDPDQLHVFNSQGILRGLA